MVSFMNEPDFDGQLERTLVAATRGCGDLGEAFAVAGRVQGADVASWAGEWTTAADTARAGADRSLDGGDRTSAARGYLRSAEYYRQATFYKPHRPRRPGLALGVRSTCGDVPRGPRAPALPGDADAGRHEDRSGGRSSRRDTCCDLTTPRWNDPRSSHRPATTPRRSGYSFAAVPALERGWNCLTFEGPGQGGTLYEDRLVLRPDYEVVVAPVIDWLLEQGGVDPEGVVLLGRSFAGYLAPRAAATEHRVAALVCDPAQFDFGVAVRQRMGDQVWRRLQDGDPTLDAELAAKLMSTPLAKNGQLWRMVAHDAGTVSDMYRELSRFSLSGLAHQIACPTLALAGEGDFAGTGQMQMFADAVQAPVTTRTLSASEGAGGHCEGLGQEVFDQFVYGWLHHQVAGSSTSAGGAGEA